MIPLFRDSSATSRRDLIFMDEVILNNMTQFSWFTFDFLMHFKRDPSKLLANNYVVSNHICQRYQKYSIVLIEQSSEIHFDVLRPKGANLSIQKPSKSIKRLPKSNCSTSVSALIPINDHTYYWFKVF